MAEQNDDFDVIPIDDDASHSADVFDAIPDTNDAHEESGIAEYQHQLADYYHDQEQQHIEAGDYEAAREDASNAASYESWADQNAGTPDQSGEAKDEYNQLDWAVWEEHQGDADAHAAESYADHGDMDHADQYADAAAGHYDAADYHTDAASHTDVDTSHTSDTSTSTDE